MVFRIRPTTEERTPGEESAAACCRVVTVVICRLCRQEAQREREIIVQRRLHSTPFSDPSRGKRKGRCEAIDNVG